MTQVFIKYNPYLVATNVKINGSESNSNNSFFNFEKGINAGKRLQEWIESVPKALYEEFSSKEFDITFHGTTEDYEDVLSVVNENNACGFKISLNHIAAKDIEGAEEEIEKVYDMLKDSPFEELRHDADIERVFNKAKNEEFEINVVATMSSGKSTLINALLGRKLMPASQEACTAVITKIKDTDDDIFSAEVFDNYDGKGNKINSSSNLTYETMKEWNSNSNTREIRVRGDIPFVEAKNSSLVLVDTPGPNNSRDENHERTTTRRLKEERNLILYVLNGTQLKTNDDSNFLKQVAQLMEHGGKKCRDRFIFVANKLDDFKKEDDNIDTTLAGVKSYLEDHGIKNPNVFPVSALTALEIRTVLKDKNANLDDDEVYEANGRLRKFNKKDDEQFHFEKKVSLPHSVMKKIEARLQKAIETGDKYEEALIHSGIVSVEEAIKLYVTKYNKTAKIKDLVDSFHTKVEEKGSLEELKQKAASDEAERNAMLSQISAIQKKLDDKTRAEEFRQKVDNVDLTSNLSNAVDGMFKQATSKIGAFSKRAGSQMDRYEAEDFIDDFKYTGEQIERDIVSNIELAIELNVDSAVEEINAMYRQNLASFMEDLSFSDIKVDPFTMMSSDLSMFNIRMRDYHKQGTSTEEVWVENTNKKWYKPWTWFQEKGHWTTRTTSYDYVDTRALVDDVITPFERHLRENCESAKNYAKEQTSAIKEQLKKLFSELDDVLKKKLDELNSCLGRKDELEKDLAQTNKKLDWAEDIKSKISQILEI